MSVPWYAEIADDGRVEVFAQDDRPLVVIDPEDREQVQRLTQVYVDHRDEAVPMFSAMQQALRSLIAPPKPDEPMGLGAVVEDAEGFVWVRGDDELWWRNSVAVHWVDVFAVKVLSDGWRA